jgi:signal transduction histidine kinase
MKHGKASFVELAIKKENENIHIDYTDDGIGFDESLVSEGLGLISIKQRLKLLKAQWSFNSQNHKGFKFNSIIPIT